MNQKQQCTADHSYKLFKQIFKMPANSWLHVGGSSALSVILSLPHIQSMCWLHKGCDSVINRQWIVRTCTITTHIRNNCQIPVTTRNMAYLKNIEQINIAAKQSGRICQGQVSQRRSCYYVLVQKLENISSNHIMSFHMKR